MELVHELVVDAVALVALVEVVTAYYVPEDGEPPPRGDNFR